MIAALSVGFLTGIILFLIHITGLASVLGFTVITANTSIIRVLFELSLQSFVVALLLAFILTAKHKITSMNSKDRRRTHDFI